MYVCTEGGPLTDDLWKPIMPRLTDASSLLIMALGLASTLTTTANFSCNPAGQHPEPCCTFAEDNGAPFLTKSTTLGPENDHRRVCIGPRNPIPKCCEKAPQYGSITAATLNSICRDPVYDSSRALKSSHVTDLPAYPLQTNWLTSSSGSALYRWFSCEFNFCSCS